MRLRTRGRRIEFAAQRRRSPAGRPGAACETATHYRISAIHPNEGAISLANDFKTAMWESHGKLPTDRDLIYTCDRTSAYEYHKQFQHMLHSEAPGTWSLNLPSHAPSVPRLLKTYPNAHLTPGVMRPRSARCLPRYHVERQS